MEDLTLKLSYAYELIATKLESWLSTAVKMLPNFVVAVLVVLAFILIAKLIKKGLKKVLPRITDSRSITQLFSSIAYIAVITGGTFVALSVLNLDKAVTSLLAGAGIIGLALGFAFQDIASNFMSGIIMAVRKPLRIGDLVETNGIFGIVERLSLRATFIQTLQGQQVIVPNKLIFENPITNFTILGKRRVDLECGVSYGDDLEKVEKHTVEAIENIEGIDKAKGVSFFYKEFGGSSINYQVRYWVEKNDGQADYLKALSNGIKAIKKVYDENDIDIPFPIRTLNFGIKGGDNLAQMLEKSENSEA